MCTGFRGREVPPAPEVVVSRHRLVCVNRTSELSGCNPYLTSYSEELGLSYRLYLNTFCSGGVCQTSCPHRLSRLPRRHRQMWTSPETRHPNSRRRELLGEISGAAAGKTWTGGAAEQQNSTAVKCQETKAVPSAEEINSWVCDHVPAPNYQKGQRKIWKWGTRGYRRSHMGEPLESVGQGQRVVGRADGPSYGLVHWTWHPACDDNWHTRGTFPNNLGEILKTLRKTALFYIFIQFFKMGLQYGCFKSKCAMVC